MPNAFNLPTEEQFDEQIAVLRLISNKMGLVEKLASWDEARYIARNGLANKYFKVGDILVSNYNDETLKHAIIGIDFDIPKSIAIQSLDQLPVTPTALFSAAQGLYLAEEVLSTGKKVFQLNGIKYEFTTTKEIPVGGQVYISAWETEGYVPTKISTYEADRVTPIESNLTVVTSTDVINLEEVNHHQRCRYGSNNYLDSILRQWLNSNEDIFKWVPKTDYDRPVTSSPYNGAGYLKRLDPELVAVIGAVEKKVARNTVTDGGGQDTFTDKIFLLSRVEVGLGSEGITTGEKVYPFYEGVGNAGRIKLRGGSPAYWWLRSPNVSNANNVRNVNSTGALDNNNAINAYGLAPDCVYCQHRVSLLTEIRAIFMQGTVILSSKAKTNR